MDTIGKIARVKVILHLSADLFGDDHNSDQIQSTIHSHDYIESELAKILSNFFTKKNNITVICTLERGGKRISNNLGMYPNRSILNKTGIA